MNTNTAAAKIVSLEIPTPAPRRAPAPAAPQPFRIVEFTNRSGSSSWRVTGHTRDGKRVRENFGDLVSAQARQIELSTAWLSKQTDTIARSTTLTDEQLRIAEACFLRLENNADMLPAIEQFIRNGRKHGAVNEQIRVDEAATRFKTWLDSIPEAEMSDFTKKNLRNRINLFVNSIPNLKLTQITPDAINEFLAKRQVSLQTRINDRLAVSRFFTWAKSQKLVASNPARTEEKIRRPARPEPAVLSVDDAEKLLRAAEDYKGGRLVPYLAVCLFGGLRPMSEALRLTWDRVNFADGELTVSSANKTKRGRTIKLDSPLREWLEAYKDLPFKATDWKRSFDMIKAKAGFGTPTKENPTLKPWVEDYARHTAISHYFRKTGSYGLTAERFGNSEGVIRAHYQGRVTSANTDRFYSIRPSKRAGE